MSHTANVHQPVFALINTVSRFFAALWTAAREQDDLDRRMLRMRKLEALSDEELAAQGIERDRIAHHVFRDIYYV